MQVVLQVISGIDIADF